MTSTRVLFVHLPKTAGVSLRAYFDRHFHPDNVHELYDGAQTTFPPSPALITGHLYGAWLDRAPRDVVTATVLREPVARIVSQYRYWRGLEVGPATSPAIRQSIAMTQSHELLELLRMNDPILRGSFENLQTQMLGLSHPRTADERLPSRGTLRAALRRLNRVACVGVSEQPTDFALAVAARCNWAAEQNLPRLNSSLTSDIVVDSEVRDEILSRNELDLRLHGEAARRGEDGRQRLDADEVTADARRSLAIDEPATTRTISIAGPFLGTGWSERQATGADSWRWTTNEESTVMTGPIISRAGTITVSQAPGLEKHEVVDPWLTLNGERLELSAGAGGDTLNVAVPRGVFADRDANVITIGARRPTPMSKFLMNGSGDPVGLAVTTITLAVE